MDDYKMDRDTRTPSTSGPFKLDEGFAEDSQQHGEQIQNSFVAWLNTQSEQTKAEIAFEILRTLRSTDIAAVVERLNPLLHMDPIDKLPTEITSQIFSYLDASTLLTASLASQTWRERILDPRLWQELYRVEGWGIDLEAVKAYERTHRDVVRTEFKKARAELREHKGQPQFKRRATSDWLQSIPRRVSADVSEWREQHEAIEADGDVKTEGGDEEMLDVPMSSNASSQRPNKRQSQDSGDEMDYRNDDLLDTNHEIGMSRQSSLASNLVVVDATGEARFNWPHVYKQRRKLEDNWLNARAKPFTLPHPAYPQEAHTECVYTIQFFGKWLVSGSRDKTLRIWDLDTGRLKCKPLVGHSQSVLCLQFDPTEEEDIIMSGSSDSSVIVWKFSTGQKLQAINSAHEESVLNLRFDHRYLVTCSKDKKIKVWNRRTLLPTDQDYPRVKETTNCKVPNYILDLTAIDISMIEARIANGMYKALRPFTHLMTFDAHTAAVNAIQIYDDLIVSASGDRLVRIWNLKTGALIKTLSGHQKGIACVQFDGRRIVSGSSDNSVRIFDPVSGVEVACLLGHTNLVRTIQAGFGDALISEEENIAAARAAERKHHKEITEGTVVDDRYYSRRLRNGEFGTSRLAIGATLPPGGGGSKWARIVSGSYDESIIIWKKDSDGNWVIGPTLKQDSNVQGRVQEDASDQNAGRRRLPRLRHTDLTVQTTRSNQPPLGNQTGPAAVNAAQTIGSGNVMSAAQIVQATVNTSLSSLQTGIQNVMGVNRNLGNASITINGMPVGPEPPPRTSSGTASLSTQTPPVYSSAVQNATNQIIGHLQNATQNAINTALTHGHANINTVVTTSSNNINHSPQSHTPPAQITSNPSMQAPPPLAYPTYGVNGAPAPPRPHGHHGPGQGHNNNNHVNGHGQGPNVSRVFKLQFDARRIVCCSQDSRITGWDFANGDADIAECSGFFLGP
ncbi:hypothetical protein H2198_002062 [Neophaeococcomyces mojaviensis]|uniref:Uncharacterized protein n=1 Tax=Neophaeococcomyces mojaviensis TaxID=3383035 RepID=A0ACC3AFB4_9EURO|nr:hypothetical protein H2198_002062 [Knufia sp. JES_112]